MTYSIINPVSTSQGLIRTIHRFLNTVGVGLFYIEPGTRTHRPLTAVGYPSRMIKFLATDFVQKDPSYQELARNPKNLMCWRDLPNFRSSTSVRTWFHPYGADEGISMVLQTPSDTCGVLHVSLSINEFPDWGVRLLEAMRPEFEMLLADIGNSFVLTDREQQILTLIADGDTNLTISSKLEISVHTVRSHLENIFRKLNVSSRAEATVQGLSLRQTAIGRV